jgi:hypothetical protein
LQRSERANSPAALEAGGLSIRPMPWPAGDGAAGARQLTQVELSDKAGIPQAQIGRIELGVGSPTSATLAKIAEGSAPTCRSSSAAQVPQRTGSDSTTFARRRPAETQGSSVVSPAWSVVRCSIHWATSA